MQINRRNSRLFVPPKLLFVTVKLLKQSNITATMPAEAKGNIFRRSLTVNL
jgi:hypothetical protein